MQTKFPIKNWQTRLELLIGSCWLWLKLKGASKASCLERLFCNRVGVKWSQGPSSFRNCPPNLEGCRGLLGRAIRAGKKVSFSAIGIRIMSCDKLRVYRISLCVLSLSHAKCHAQSRIENPARTFLPVRHISSRLQITESRLQRVSQRPRIDSFYVLRNIYLLANYYRTIIMRWQGISFIIFQLTE